MTNRNEVGESRAQSAERMRRSRDRLRNGLRNVSLDVRESEVELLVRKAFLKPAARHDRGAVGDALRAFLTHTLDRARRRDSPGSFTVDLEPEHIERLVRRGRLLAGERHDPDAVLQAFSAVVHEAFWRL
jgi:hypothetical protein